MQDFWDDRARSLIGGLDWAALRYIRNLTRGIDLPRTRVLELGCGIGSVGAELHRLGATVTAVDFSPEMIQRARETHGEPPGLRFVHGDVRSMDLDQQFDLICGIAVLHEIDRSAYGSLITFLDRHLGPGAFGCFLENSYFNPLFRLFREHCVGRYGIPRYGSVKETPFDNARWTLLQEHFRYSTRTGEVFYLLARVEEYVLRSRWPSIKRLCTQLDQGISDLPDGRRFKALFSYYQTVYFSHTRPAHHV
jgi:SAM-dependent methyltransferase